MALCSSIYSNLPRGFVLDGLVTERLHHWDYRMKYSASTWTLLLFLFFGYHANAHSSSAPTLSSDTDIAGAGYYRLSWETDYPKVELQEALDASFAGATSIYSGSDHASLLSGKSNATYYYRVRGIDADDPSDWSQPVSVKVAHHSLDRAFSILGLGFVIFLALVVVILRGEGKHA